MQLAQALTLLVGSIGGVLSLILVLKRFTPERRKLEADTGKVMTETAVLWMDRYETLVEYVDLLEATQNDLFDYIRDFQYAQAKWLQQVISTLEDRGVMLPPMPNPLPIPPRSKRPPRQRKEG